MAGNHIRKTTADSDVSETSFTGDQKGGKENSGDPHPFLGVVIRCPTIGRERSSGGGRLSVSHVASQGVGPNSVSGQQVLRLEA